MNTVTALQNVHVAMGGKLTDVIDLFAISELINPLANLECEKRRIVLLYLTDRNENYLTDRKQNNLIVRERSLNNG